MFNIELYLFLPIDLMLNILCFSSGLLLICRYCSDDCNSRILVSREYWCKITNDVFMYIKWPDCKKMQYIKLILLILIEYNIDLKIKHRNGQQICGSMLLVFKESCLVAYACNEKALLSKPFTRISVCEFWVGNDLEILSDFIIWSWL